MTRFLLRAVLVLSACGGLQPRPAAKAAPAPDPWAQPAAAEPSAAVPTADEILARYADLTRRVCQCTDNDCLARVTDERNRLGYEMRQKNAAFHWTPEQDAKGKQATDQYMACVKRVLTPEPARPRESEERVLRPMAAFRDEMCACTTRDCQEHVAAAMSTHARSVAHVPLDDDENARLKMIGDEMLKCSVRRPSP